MSLLSHGAEPSRWETHHILIAAWKELCWKGFSPMSLSLGVEGRVALVDCDSFQRNWLRNTTMGWSLIRLLAEAKKGD